MTENGFYVIYTPMSDDISFHPFAAEAIEQSIPARFEQQARLAPHRVAVDAPDGRLTYAELDHRATRIARTILARLSDGNGPVALLLDHGAGIVAAILGVLKTGRSYVAIDPSWPDARAADVLDDSGARLLVTDAARLARARSLARGGAEILDADAPPAGGSARLEIGPVAADSPALLLYTSGSTGRPKAVLHSHRNILVEARTYTNDLRVRPGDRLALLHSCSFSNSVRHLYAALCGGATLCPYDLAAAGVETLAAWIRDQRITLLHTAATTYRSFLDTVTDDRALATLRALRLGGEPITGDDVQRFRRHFPAGCALWHAMGPTETLTLCRHVVVPEDHAGDGRVPVGYPAPGKTVLIWDEAGREVGPGEIGEIVVRSAHLALGYWRRPELTAAAFLPDPAGGPERLYRTGDLGVLRADGCLTHVGRRDQQVKIRGYRVEIAEVEGVLRGLEGVASAVVDARPDEAGEPRLVAYVVPAPVGAPTVSALRRGLERVLPAYMTPSAIVFLDALPSLPSGKIDRRALPAPGRARPPLDAPYAAPRTPIEARVARLWSDVLRLDRVGIRDRFLDLGGDSLLASRVVTRVMAEFRIELPPQALLALATVAEMAAVVLERCLEQAGPAAVAELLGEPDAGPCA